MVRVALIGFGNTGWNMLKILRDKDAEIIAVFNRKANIGRDAGGIGCIGKRIICHVPCHACLKLKLTMLTTLRIRIH